MADSTLFQTVLCPVDFSDHSRQALAYAALLAARSKGRLVVIFVEDPLLAAAAAVAYDEKALIDKGRKELRRLVERTIAPSGLTLAAIGLAFDADTIVNEREQPSLPPGPDTSRPPGPFMMA